MIDAKLLLLQHINTFVLFFNICLCIYLFNYQLEWKRVLHSILICVNFHVHEIAWKCIEACNPDLKALLPLIII